MMRLIGSLRAGLVASWGFRLALPCRAFSVALVSLLVTGVSVMHRPVGAVALAGEEPPHESGLSDGERLEKARVFVSDSSPEEAHNQRPEQLKSVDVRERLGESVDLSLSFLDEDGHERQLREFFDGERPVLLSLNYYDCATLCTLQLTGIANALGALDWLPGRDFKMVTVSIDPDNTPDLARLKKAAYLEHIDRDGADWAFLLGLRGSETRLAENLGFGYSYDEDTDQYAHPAVTYLLTPDGRVSRYLYGIDPSARDLKFALMEASEGRLGTTLDRFILSCFHYDDLRGQYTPFALNSMRVGGLVTVSCIGVWLGTLWKREKRKRLRENIS
jgi:protein SCO1/2